MLLTYSFTEQYQVNLFPIFFRLAIDANPANAVDIEAVSYVLS